MKYPPKINIKTMYKSAIVDLHPSFSADNLSYIDS